MKIAPSSILVLVLVCGLAAAARADNPQADAKFQLGKRLLAQKHYAEACEAFEDSNKLEPGIGAELNVGHCYEEWGKLATAYRAYDAALTMATRVSDARVAKIKERIEALDAQVPRLTLEVAKDANTAGLVVTLDGQPVLASAIGTEQRVDPGPHRLEYAIGGQTKRTKTIPLERGGSSDITLELPHLAPGAVAAANGGRVGASETLPPPGQKRRVEGAITMEAGAVLMGVAGVLTFSARGSYKDSLAADCNNSPSMCDAAGLETTHDARREANVATVVFGVGAAAAVVGVVLYVTAPKHETHGEHATRIVPVASPDHVGFAVLGRF